VLGVDVPRRPPSETPPSKRHPISDSAKGWTGILTGIAGVITALAALNKEPEEKAARQSYEVLSARIEQLAVSQRQLQDDVRRQGEWLANLRGYVQGARSEPLESRPPMVSAGRRPPPEPEPEAPEEELPPPPKPRAPSLPAARLPSFEQIQRAE
jgi:hypothetical protein